MRATGNSLIHCLLILVTLALPGTPLQAAERYKPFVLAWRGNDDFGSRLQQVRQSLKTAGFGIVADVTPYPEQAYLDELHILVVTSAQLKRSAARSQHGGFAAALRISVSRVGDDIQVSYVNPVYLAHAYRLRDDLKTVAQQLSSALGHIRDFGSEKGLTGPALRTYRYTFGMEYFDEPYELATFTNYHEALEQVTQNLAQAGDIGIRQVYRVDIPGKQETIIGITRRGEGEDGKYYDDHWIMDNVDFGELHTTAYLPYEIMITGNRVIALSMRFRMAVHHPDLSMKGKDSFMNIIPSPLAVKNALTTAVKGTAARQARL